MASPISNQPIQEASLIAALKQQDRKAFALLYDNYAAALLGVIFKIVPDTEAAEELLQDSFLKIWNNVQFYDASKGRLFTWMLNIARNTAIDYARVKKNNRQNQDIDLVVNSIDKQQIQQPSIDSLDVAELTKRLSTEHQRLVDLIYLQGYTQAETAELLQIPLGTVKTRLRAALLQLRKVFVWFFIVLLTNIPS